MSDALYMIASAIYWVAAVLFFTLQVICDIYNPRWGRTKLNFGTAGILMMVLAVFQSIRTVHWGQ